MHRLLPSYRKVLGGHLTHLRPFQMGVLSGHSSQIPFEDRMGVASGQVQLLVLWLNERGVLQLAHAFDVWFQYEGGAQLTQRPVALRWGALSGQLHFCNLAS